MTSGRTRNQSTQAAYNRLLPLTEQTRRFTNGLMVVVRPVIEQLVEVSDKTAQVRHIQGMNSYVNGVYKTTKPPVRGWSIKMRDTFEPGKRRGNATLLDTEISFDGTRLDNLRDRTGLGSIGKTVLTWGLAKSKLSPVSSSTFSGIGSNRPEQAFEPGAYDTIGKLKRDYAGAYVSRIGSGLLVAQMVGLAAAEYDIEMRDLTAAGESLVEDWRDVDVATADKIWDALNGPITS